MASPAEDASFLSQALGWVVAGVAGLAAWVWNHTMGRIKKLEETKLDKAEFDKYVIQQETHRREFRDGQIATFNKIDELKTLLLEKLK